MIESKKLTIISVIFMVLAVVLSLVIWIYSFEYKTNAEFYNDVKIVYTSDDEYNSDKLENAAVITGKNNKITCGSNAYAVGETVYITAGGLYSLSGNFENIVIQSADERPVVIELNDAYIESSSQPPIYAYKASKLILSSRKDTANYIVDKRGKYSDQTVTAAVYSVADLTLNGEGDVSVKTNYQDAIKSDMNVKIMSGLWSIAADDDGISGNSVCIKGGKVACNTGGDSIRSDEKNNKGLIVLNGGQLSVTSRGDAVYSSGDVFIGESNLDIVTVASDTSEQMNDAPSVKGVKADKGIYISGGKCLFDTADDGIHAAEMIRFDGGEMEFSSGDDAIHCDKDLVINYANINITNCYEGIESAYLEINDGEINIKADDDGINVSNGENSMMGGPPPDMGGNVPPGMPQGETGNGEDPAATPKEVQTIPPTSKMDFKMNGGNVYIEARGDGVDINGSCEMNGGRIIAFAMVDGPETAFDYDGIFLMNGGSVFGAGNPNMFMPPSEESKQNSLVCYVTQTYRSGGLIEITDSAGNIVEHADVNGSFGIIIAYGQRIKNGETYVVSVNGEEIGKAQIDGINTIIMPEGANVAGGGMPGGAPPMGADGRPLEAPPDGGGPGGAPGGAPPMDADGRPLEAPPDGGGPGGMPGGAPPMSADGRPLEAPPDGGVAGVRRDNKNTGLNENNDKSDVNNELEISRRNSIVTIALASGGILIMAVFILIVLRFKRKY